MKSGLKEFEGDISLKEITSDPVTEIGYGQLYVKADKKLYFKDSAGTVINLAVGGTSGSATTVPIGSIHAWHKNLAGVPPLTSEWVECNGQTLSDAGSPLNGQIIPDLNGQAKFLRGSSSSGTTQNATQVAVTVKTSFKRYYFADDGQNMTAYNNDFDSTVSTASAGYINRMAAGTGPYTAAGRVRPTNMSVVWIMRIK